MLDRRTLEREIAEGRIDTVLTGIPDLYGRLVGKRIHAPYFASEVLGHGMHVCDYLLACDMEMDPTPGYRFASWETGYADSAFRRHRSKWTKCSTSSSSPSRCSRR